MRKLWLFICLPMWTLSVRGNDSLPVVNRWELSGIDGITAFGIIDHNGVLYSGTAGSGIYRSADQGENWIATNNGLTNLTVRSLLSKGKQIYAGTKDGVFMSSDDGKTWSHRNNGMDANTSVFSLLEVKGTLFAGSKAGIYRSTDEGASWILSIKGFTGQPYVYALCYQAPYVFAGTESNSVMKSSDDGLSWAAAHPGITAAMTISSFHMVDDRTIICGTDGAGCFVTNDRGLAWKPVTNGFTNDRVFGFTSEKTSLYAGAVNAVFKSTDDGVSWTAIPMEGLPGKAYINSILTSKGKLFVNTDLGIYCYKE